MNQYEYQIHPFKIFKSLGWFEIAGRGKVASVLNPFACEDFIYLIDTKVSIDNTLYWVRGVERFAHAPPWKKGEPIGLLVELVNPDE